MTYKEAELLNARLRRAAVDCLIDAINFENDAEDLDALADRLRQQARLLNDAASDVWSLVDNYRFGGVSNWADPF